MYASRLLLAGGLLVAPGAALAAITAAACPQPAQVAGERWPGEAQWLAIQRSGLRYGVASIEVDNVYDLADPRENVWYTRTADFLHIRTRDWVVHHLLLIQPGDPATRSRCMRLSGTCASRPSSAGPTLRPSRAGTGW